jgi:hypothetical protein
MVDAKTCDVVALNLRGPEVICIIELQNKNTTFVKLVFCRMKTEQNGDFMKPGLNFLFVGDIC